jgi:hypothetical protein
MHFSPLHTITGVTIAGSIASAALLAGGDAALPLGPPRFERTAPLPWVGNSRATREPANSGRRSRDVQSPRRGEPPQGRPGR